MYPWDRTRQGHERKYFRRKRKKPKTILRLPDLEIASTAVLRSPTSPVRPTAGDAIGRGLRELSLVGLRKGQGTALRVEYVVREIEIPPSKAAPFRLLQSAILANEKNAAVLKKE